jgi:hypothetical protein
MNVHPAVKIIRINYTTYGISYSFVNIRDSEKEVVEKFRLRLLEKENLIIKKNQ